MKPTEYIVREILKRPQAQPPKETKTATIYYVKRRPENINWLEIRIPKLTLSPKQYRVNFVQMLRNFFALDFKFSMEDLIGLLMALEKEESNESN